MERSRPVNSNELDEKLRPTRQPTPKDDFHAECVNKSRAYAEENYNTLIRKGGRPTRPIQYDPVLPIQHEPGRWVYPDGHTRFLTAEEEEESTEESWVRDHWGSEGSRFKHELTEWQLFRGFQRKFRPKNPEDIPRFQQPIDDYCRKNGIKEEWKPQVHIEPKMRTKLDEWKEFYFYQHTRLANYDWGIEEAEEQAESKLKAFDEAEPKKATGKKWIWGDEFSREEFIMLEIGLIRTNEEQRESWRNIRLDWIEQQFQVIASQCGITNGTALKTSKLNHSPRQDRPPSRETKQPTVYLALSPTGLSKVSKPARTKPSTLDWRRRSLRWALPSLEKYALENEKGLNMKQQLPSSTVAPPRSLRISEPRGQVVVSLAEQPPPNVILRRSERIFKQKGGMSRLVSNEPVASTVASQTDPFEHLSQSKSKRRIAGNYSDISTAKPRGISKRQRRGAFGKRIKIQAG
ncbi:MAG: hypothetical protein Q9217_001842 [Psora testacea]